MSVHKTARSADCPAWSWHQALIREQQSRRLRAYSGSACAARGDRESIFSDPESGNDAVRPSSLMPVTCWEA
ncbi:hypothetical protein LOC54_09290 [Acetobacter sp. AN02]|uniref:hypothetical protein n=1 Tax=Acetobacter sp. AN02 TaxID=2894186 RepID=UPI0024346511|nr:hypothetical protein [Acetobacter sp. AN02]MDG6095294.1 hypothetical protein [Acetobacter sp. AN02]